MMNSGKNGYSRKKNKAQISNFWPIGVFQAASRTLKMTASNIYVFIHFQLSEGGERIRSPILESTLDLSRNLKLRIWVSNFVFFWNIHFYHYLKLLFLWVQDCREGNHFCRMLLSAPIGLHYLNFCLNLMLILKLVIYFQIV